MEVSRNGGTPESSIFLWSIKKKKKTSIWGSPMAMETPIEKKYVYFMGVPFLYPMEISQ